MEFVAQAACRFKSRLARSLCSEFAVAQQIGVASGNFLSELTVELAPLILGLIARGILLNLNKEVIGIVLVGP